MGNSVCRPLVFCAVFCAGMLPSAFAATSTEQGNWQFSYTGQDSGHGSATVTPNGSIIGRAHSDRFNFDLTLGGTVAADGTLTIKGTPEGSTSTGALFSGRMQGDHASGQWRADTEQMTGTWTAERGPGGGAAGNGAHCTIAGQQFDGAAPFVVDAMVSPRDGNTRFRVILHNGGVSDGNTSIEAMTNHVSGPGSYPMSTEPTWRSSAIVSGKKAYVDTGTITLTQFSKTNASIVKGSLSFNAHGNSGQCSFELPMTVMDPMHPLG